MTQASPVRLGTRDVIGLGLVAAFVPMNSTMIAVALPDIGDDFDIASGTAGYLITVYLFVMLIGQPIAGRIADRIGMKVALYGALTGFLITSVMASLAGSFALLVLFRALQAACGTIFMPGSQAVVRSLSPLQARGRNMGIVGAFIGVGAGAGPIIGGLVTALGGWQGVFLVNLPLAAAALVLVFLLPQPPRVDPSEPDAPDKGLLRRVITERVFLSAYGTQASATFAQYALLLVVPIVLDHRGWGPGAVGAGLAALTIGNATVSSFGGSLGDRFGRRRPVFIGLVIQVGAIFACALTITNSPAALLVALTVFGIGSGLAMPSVITSALEAAPDKVAASTAGIFSTSRYAGSIPASILLAIVVTDGAEGARTMLVVATVAVALALLTSRGLPNSPSHQGDPTSKASSVVELKPETTE